MVRKKDFEVKDNLLSSFGLVFLYFFIVLGFIFGFPYLLPSVFRDGSEFNTNFLWFVLVCIVVLGPLPFYLGIRRMAIWAEPRQKFRGKAGTMKDLLSMNSPKYPFKLVKGKKYDMLLKFRLADAKWKGILFRGGLKKAYFLYLKFDEKKKTVYCVEHTRPLKWSSGVGVSGLGVRVGFSVFYGIIIADAEKLKVYDPLQGFKKVGDVSYSVREAKWPIFKTIVADGWTVRPRIFPFQVRKDQSGISPALCFSVS